MGAVWGDHHCDGSRKPNPTCRQPEGTVTGVYTICSKSTGQGLGMMVMSEFRYRQFTDRQFQCCGKLDCERISVGPELDGKWHSETTE